MEDHRRRYYAQAFADNGVLQIVAATDSGFKGFVVTSYDELCDVAARFRDCNLYHSLNRPHENATPNVYSGKHISAITRLLFDIDPIRPEGQQSTDEQREGARAHAALVYSKLSELGWPDPARGDSGNGAHLIYRTCLDNNDETMDMLKTLFAGLGHHFTFKGNKFDTVTYNACRLCRAYGYPNLKYDEPLNTGVILPSGEWGLVTFEDIRLARADNEKPVTASREPNKSPRVGGPKPNCKGDLTKWDIADQFRANDWYRGDMGGGKHAVTCPWSDEHSTDSFSGTVIWEANGDLWPTFHCSHAHCAGRSIIDVISLLDVDPFCR